MRLRNFADITSYITGDELNEIQDAVFEEIQSAQSTEVVSQDNEENYEVTVNLSGMHKDFAAVRSLLSEQINSVNNTLSVIGNEIYVNPQNAELVTSYAELLRAQNESIRAIINSYKDAIKIVQESTKINKKSDRKDVNLSLILKNLENKE